MYETELYHYGIKGMKWGVRRYQNKDGSLTDKGIKRYYNDDGSLTKRGKKKIEKAITKGYKGKHTENRVLVDKERKREANKEFDREYDKALIKAAKDKNVYKKYFDKNGNFNGDGGEAISLMGEDKFNKLLDKTNKKYESKYREKYFEATLKDVGMPVTENGKAYVNEVLNRKK